MFSGAVEIIDRRRRLGLWGWCGPCLLPTSGPCVQTSKHILEIEISATLEQQPGNSVLGWVPDLMTPSVIPFWNRLTECNHIPKEKVKKFVMVNIFFWNFTSASAKSNFAKGGVPLAQIKIFFYKNGSL